MKTKFDSIEAVLADLRKGKMVIVVDDADRENEGDLIVAAEKATPQPSISWSATRRGLVCVPMTRERLQQLGINAWSGKTANACAPISRSAWTPRAA